MENSNEEKSLKDDLEPYKPHNIESRLAQKWEESEIFEPELSENKPPYCIVIPPPNVTGALHMGHALMLTLEDILIRFKKMTGFDTFWVPGTDHAGIATQMVVDRKLKSEGIERLDIGREKFVEEVWKWREQYGNRINKQMRVMGCGLAWSNYHFTLDDDLSKAVKKTFVALYKEGLIYRDKRLIHWCPKDRTALSDLEVDFKEVKGKLYHIRYPLKDGGHVVVSTTRPETILGDTGLAIHPEDKRYVKLHGTKAIVPFVEREIPVVQDAELVDMDFGTGVVKVTPAHDFNDFETGLRHNLDQINILDEAAVMNKNAGQFAGLPVMECRKKLVEELDKLELLEGVEDYVNQVGHSERSGVVVEPRLSTQWFLKAKVLAEPALEAVKTGKTKIIPENYSKIYYHWLENIKDWCLSRQLWWGHRIPAWHCDDCSHISVSEADLESCESCGSNAINQDNDVLDTWYSSALWPFSTLGWPDKTPQLEKYYPTAVLETGYDILFFWVARMMMMGIKFMGEVPFKHIYLHTMIRDKKGQKMSKTKNNVIDPLDVSSEYSVDSLRFTLASLNTPGRDIRLDTKVIKGYAAFANKLWNASRLLKITEGRIKEPLLEEFEGKNVVALLSRLIPAQINHLNKKIRENIEKYRFDEACHNLYQYIWYEFCDWHLETLKTLSTCVEERDKLISHYQGALDDILKFLHPFMPFISEELWQRFGKREGFLVQSQWKEADRGLEISAEDQKSYEGFKSVVSSIRSIRGEIGLSPGLHLPMTICCDENKKAELSNWSFLIQKMGKIDDLCFATEAPHFKVTSLAVAEGLEIYVDLSAHVEPEKEMKRLKKALDKTKKEVLFISKKLANPNFVDKAPEELVIEHKEKLSYYQEAEAKLTRNLGLFEV